MPHDVFISYSSKDKQIADAICTSLEANEVRCWYAPRDVRAGVEWTSAIMEGITQSHVMILVWSSSSNTSKDVTREVKHAFRHDVTVIPFRVEDITATLSLQYYLEGIPLKTTCSVSSSMCKTACKNIDRKNVAIPKTSPGKTREEFLTKADFPSNRRSNSRRLMIPKKKRVEWLPKERRAHSPKKKQSC